MPVQMLGIKTKFTDDQGRPLIGGSVHTYFAGTSLPQDTYSDPELTVPNTNPVKLDDAGSADIFLKGTYRVRVFDSRGKFIEEQDNVSQLATTNEVAEKFAKLKNESLEFDDELKSNLKSVTRDISEVKAEQQKHTESLDELQSRGVANKYSNARIVFNAPLMTSKIKEIIVENKYKWMSLQSVIPVDSLGILLVQYYAQLFRGSEHKVWYAAYNLSDPSTPLAHFSTDGWGAEGGYAKVVGNQIYLVQQSKSGSNSELGVYRLPADLEKANNKHYNPLYSYTGGFGTCVGGFGDNVIVEQTPEGLKFERSNLRVYDFNNLIGGSLGKPLTSVSLSNAYLQTKPQGISLSSNNIYTGSGGVWRVGDNLKLDYNTLSIIKYGLDGTVSQSLSLHPEKFLNKLEEFIPNNREKVENEGVFVSKIEGKERLYATYLLGDRVVVLEHNAETLSDSIDMSDVTVNVLNNTIFDSKSVTTTVPIDKTTGERLLSWSAIARYMKTHNINKYVFYDDGKIARPSEVPDTIYCQIEFYGNVGFTTYQFNAQSYSRSMNGSFQYPSDSTGLDGKVFLSPFQKTTSRGAAYNSKHIVTINSRGLTFYNQSYPKKETAIAFRSAESGELVGSISFGDGVTTYNTTSDPRVKTPFKKHTHPLDDFKKISNCLGVYQFKNNPDKSYLGFNAHELIDTDLDIATEGEGGRELPIGAVYDTKAIETPDGIEQQELLVTPASVDYSKVVPYLVSALDYLIDNLDLKNTK